MIVCQWLGFVNSFTSYILYEKSTQLMNYPKPTNINWGKILLRTIPKSIERVKFGNTLLVNTHYPNALYTCKWNHPHYVEQLFKLGGMLNFGINVRGLKKNLIKYERLSADLKKKNTPVFKPVWTGSKTQNNSTKDKINVYGSLLPWK